MNKDNRLKHGITLCVIILFIGLIFIPNLSGNMVKRNNGHNIITDPIKLDGYCDSVNDDETEYWALLIAVGKYFLHPWENRPLMLEALEDINEALLSSDNWQESNIKIIKGREATRMNIIQGFRWLDAIEDSNDFSVIWIATHGYHMKRLNGDGLDFPPFDEDDGSDEALITYFGFSNLLLNLRDDVLNLLLSRLESKGICLIVDSCYSGGFNDNPYEGTMHKYTASTFLDGLAEDVGGENRVVLMSAREDTPSWFSRFSMYLAEGLQGPADIVGNGDGIVTAEEGFYYAKPLVEDSSDGRQCPTILDLFHGELPLVDISD